ncbi:MAG: hypothetical protein SGILL_003749, partial [Bacillariaceae sp.]
DMNYAVRTSRIIFDALPASQDGDYVGVLLMKKDDDMARQHTNAIEFKSFLQEEIPQLVEFLEDTTVERVAARPPSNLPMFRYVTEMQFNGNILLMGDCAHTVKPYFGMGANSALEDVRLLSDCIDAARAAKSSNDYKDLTTLKLALRKFSTMRSPDIEKLVKVSHSLDRPGVEGVFTFLIPIILDGIFSKILPQVFQPNIISMLQNEEITFQEAAARKQQDRVLQIAILAVVGFGLAQLPSTISGLFDAIV